MALHRKTMVFLAGLFTATWLFAAMEFPLHSKWGGPADFTFAVANQDTPSGIYYDCDFDWPTGEAVWSDVPVWTVDGILLVCAVGFWWLGLTGKSHANARSTCGPDFTTR